MEATMSFRNGIIETINKHGHQLIGTVDEAGRSFTYTIGLTATFGTELLVVGLPYKYSSIVNDIAKALPLALDVPLTEFTNLPLMLKRCTIDFGDLHHEYVVQADNFYGKDVNVVQIVMCDRNGKFPGHPEYEQEYMGPRQRLFYTP
jgi:hypothetical protein